MEEQKKKLLIAIQSSNQELYAKNTKVIKEIYRKMLETFDLSDITVDVISFTAGDKTELIGDTLYTDCLDSDEYLKHRILCEYLLQHPEYDYIIKTNATTLVNLSYINTFIKESHIDKDTFYGMYALHMPSPDGNGFLNDHPFIPGNAIMATGEDFRNKLCNLEIYDRVYRENKDQYEKIHGSVQTGTVMWRGMPEDVIWGFMLQDYDNIELVSLDDSIILSGLFGGFGLISEDENLARVFDRNAFVNVKLGNLPQEVRVKLEPLLLTLFGRIILQEPVTEIGYFSYHYNMINKTE